MEGTRGREKNKSKVGQEQKGRGGSEERARHHSGPLGYKFGHALKASTSTGWYLIPFTGQGSSTQRIKY